MFIEKLITWLSRPTSEEGVNLVTAMPIVLETDKGLVRTENQDCVAAMRVNISQNTKPFVVIALVDGMGGMKNGSECAIHALASFFYNLIHLRKDIPKSRLKIATLAANKYVYDFAQGSGGATLSAILISEDSKPLFVNVGDSRIYVSSDNNSKISRITIDDSLEEAVGGYGKELLQFIGMGEGIKPHIGHVPEKTDRVFITSDGVHFLNQKTFYDVLSNAPDIFQTAKRIEKIVRWCGAHDNASMAITAMTDLLKSLSKSNENGVEFWDSFGALNVLWINENEKDEFENASKFVKQIISELPPTKNGETNNSSNENTPDRKSSSKKKRKEKFEYSDKNKIEIVIEPKDKDETPK
jgi:serine/threonine protein phosphatase PrpC